MYLCDGFVFGLVNVFGDYCFWIELNVVQYLFFKMQIVVFVDQMVYMQIDWFFVEYFFFKFIQVNDYLFYYIFSYLVEEEFVDVWCFFIGVFVQMDLLELIWFMLSGQCWIGQYVFVVVDIGGFFFDCFVVFQCQVVYCVVIIGFYVGVVVDIVIGSEVYFCYVNNFQIGY